MLNLLFSPSGRIGPSDFMKGAIVVIVISAILNILPMINFTLGSTLSMLGIVLIWPIVVLAVKRAHDAGKSGWMCLLPIIALIILSVITGMIINKVFGGSAYADMQAATKAAAESGNLQDVMKIAKEQGAAMAKKTVLPQTIAGAVIMYVVAYVYNMMMAHDPNDNQWGPAN